MKKLWRTYIKPLYVTNRWNISIACIVILFIVRFFIPWLGVTPFIALLVLLLLVVRDYLLLFGPSAAIRASRHHAVRFSNGDENEVVLYIENRYNTTVKLAVIDEVPFQFQRRDIIFSLVLNAASHKKIKYNLRPVKRGIYQFGVINIFVSLATGLLQRRYIIQQYEDVPVYPSYMQMKRYQLLALHNRLTHAGIKKIRKLGHSMEFEQIKEYVPGDDYRTLNWKATARKGQLMVNSFTDEKSQPVYCVIDKGRVMKMPFAGMSLMDYAINATLVLSNVALIKSDKAGLITFSEKSGAFLAAGNKPVQMQSILELLYHQKTRYLESDFELLYTTIRHRIHQRSFVVLFTNFETVTAVKRQLPYLKKIAQHHLLLLVMFENTELKALAVHPAADVKEVYMKVVAEKFAFEKRQVVKELQQHGIIAMLTSPGDLTVNTINKYLEIKAKNSL